MAFGFKCPRFLFKGNATPKQALTRKTHCIIVQPCSTKCSQASILFYNLVCESLKQVDALKNGKAEN